MALIESMITEDGIVERNKIKDSIDLLKEFEPMALALDPEGYYLTYSGGKDSDTNLEICLMSGVKFSVNYNITSVDPPEVVKHIKRTREVLKGMGINLYMHPPDVFTTGPFKGLRKNMWRLIVHKKMPPTRTKRYCCAAFKENGGRGKFCITGVRWAESVRRKKDRRALEIFTSKKENRKLFNDNDDDRRQFEYCSTKGKRVVNPIISWEDYEVWEFLKLRRTPYCKYYDEGWDRIGCIGCPIGGTKGQEEDFERFPYIKILYIKAFDDMLEYMRSEGNKIRGWKTGDDVFEWWLYSADKEQYELLGQTNIFGGDEYDED